MFADWLSDIRKGNTHMASFKLFILYDIFHTVEKVYDLPMRKPIHMNAAQAAECVAIFIHKKKELL